MSIWQMLTSAIYTYETERKKRDVLDRLSLRSYERTKRGICIKDIQRSTDWLNHMMRYR